MSVYACLSVVSVVSVPYRYTSVPSLAQGQGTNPQIAFSINGCATRVGLTTTPFMALGASIAVANTYAVCHFNDESGWVEQVRRLDDAGGKGELGLARTPSVI